MTPLSSRMSDVDDVSSRRQEVLEAAAAVLAEDGPHGLSLRRVATAAGGSTQLVYTLFGGKPGLADALYAEGFRRLGEAMRVGLATAPPSGDPERLMAIGRAYRGFAQAEPAFYAIMFGRAIPDFTPTASTRLFGRACTFGQVVDEVQACLDAGTLVGTEAEELARLCWINVHGLSSLEIAGLLGSEDPEAFLEHALRTPLVAHRPPLG